MTINEYQQLAQRTASTITRSIKIENGIYGLCGESGECIDLWKKAVFQGHTLDKTRIAEELGDVLWYAAECLLKTLWRRISKSCASGIRTGLKRSGA